MVAQWLALLPHTDANQHVFAVFCTIFVTKYGNTIFMLQIRLFKIQNCARFSDKLGVTASACVH